MKMLSTLAHQSLKILFACLIVALVTLVMNATRNIFSTAVIALIFLLPVILSTTTWGFSAGIAASILSFLLFNYFFFPPYYSFRVGSSQDFIVLLVFLVVAVVISDLVGRAQRRLEQVQAREREATHLYELSLALTGLKDENEIACILADHLLEIFQASRVEVTIQNRKGQATIQAIVPEDTPLPPTMFQTARPLNTNRGSLGEIRLWTEKAGFSSIEQRLLQTIASQAALSIERVFLSETETRAKILEESDRLKTALLSSVSHDLRTPLASIEASATTLINPKARLEPRAKAELQSILVEEIERLNQLVGNLLNMSRIEAGALQLQRKLNSIAEIVEMAIERMTRQSAGFLLENEISDDMPLIPLDSVLMEQVFINLISNSLKYAPKNSQICFDAHQSDDEWIEVLLTNHGPRIPEEHLERVFDKFYSFPGLERVGGTGLGLSICKGIVEAHGGKIWVTNLADGIAFHLSLPTRSVGFSSLPPLHKLEGL